MDLLSTALSAAEAGGEVIERYYHNGVTMRSKATAVDLVSDADVHAERAIVETIRSRFPDHAILGEEESAADVTAEHLWVIDPLDGTTNFAHHIPHFAVSIAYLRNGRAECGVILNPIRKDRYVAVRGGGAQHNGRAIRVSAATQMSECLIGIGFYYDRGAMMEATLSAVRDCFRRQIHGVRRFGTASLDLAHVACGMYGAYFESQLSAWDFAAGALLVEEAGGRTSTCSGQPLPVGRTTVLASNGHVHDEMLAITRQHWDG